MVRQRTRLVPESWQGGPAVCTAGSVPGRRQDFMRAAVASTLMMLAVAVRVHASGQASSLPIHPLDANDLSSARPWHSPNSYGRYPLATS